MKKKKLWYFMIMVFACVLFIHSTVKADIEHIVLDGGVTLYYKDNGDGTVNITQIEITGSVTKPDVIIPATIDGKKISEIAPYSYSDTREFDKIKSLEFEEGNVSVNSTFNGRFTGVERLKIPSTMTFIEGLYGMKNLREIEVAQGNTAYCSENNVLYNVDKTELVAYPVKRDGEVYTIPDTVKRMSRAAFRNVSGLKTLHISANVGDINPRTFTNFVSCEAINVDANNLYYSSVDGILFDKDKEQLLAVPSSNNMTVLDIPDTVAFIRDSAINNHQSLKKIIVPQSVSFVNTNAINNCALLESIIFKGKAIPYIEISNCGDVRGYYDSSIDNWENCIKNSPSLLWEDYASYKNASELQIGVDSDSVAVGNTLQMRALLNPLLECNFIWTSSNNAIATVNNTGTVIGFKTGTVTITAFSSDGKYVASKTISVIGEQATLPQHSIVEASEFADISTKKHQFASDVRNGIYYFVNDDLYLYLLGNNTNVKIYAFDTIDTEYFANNKLYVSSNDKCYVLNLKTHQIEHDFNPKESDISAIGADIQGRIYVAGMLDGIYHISMYSASGEYITSTATDNKVYCFDGFDAATGNIYYETYSNWRYWGYDHPGKSIVVAKVSGNTIKLVEINSSVNMGGMISSIAGLEYACQNSYYEHYFNADLIAENCLVTTSTTFGRVQFIKSSSDDHFEVTKVLEREGMENSTGIYEDDSSIGVRAVYNKGRDSIILYENGKVLNEYDRITGEKRGTFTLQHYVYNLCQIGATVVAIEKEDGKYYIEFVNWSDTDDLEIKGNVSMKSGETQHLESTMSSVYKEQVNWSSSDNEVVAVSKAGVASAWREGTAVITCTTKDGRKKANFTIQVTSDKTTSILDSFSLSSGVTLSQNQSLNNYTTWSKTVKSYLYENSDHSLTRVEYVGDKKVVVENYRLGKLESSKTIDAELELFGGFYHGNDYNYMVYGASNMHDSDDVEVIRVVKYDKDFNKLASKSISAVNTYIPFEAGSLRMDETASKLYIYTCHEMYQSSDGYHHQANMTFVLNEETLDIEDSYSDVMNIAQAGYVSHSFNQFIKTDGTSVYRVDHGDANPRAVSITKCDVNGKITSVSYNLLLSIQGEHGVNVTGVSVGGLELSDSNCIVVGNSVDQSDAGTYDSRGTRNIFVSVTDKALNDTQTKWITSYTKDDKIQTCTPQLVKLDAAHFLILWEERDTETGQITTKAVTIDEEATMTIPVCSISARLSDCQPIVTADEMVRWYVTDGSAVTFYELAPYALGQMQSTRYGDINGDGAIDIVDGVLLKKHLAKMQVVISEKAADVNGDGNIEIADAVLLLKYLAGMKVELGR